MNELNKVVLGQQAHLGFLVKKPAKTRVILEQLIVISTAPKRSDASVTHVLGSIEKRKHLERGRIGYSPIDLVCRQPKENSLFPRFHRSNKCIYSGESL